MTHTRIKMRVSWSAKFGLSWHVACPTCGHDDFHTPLRRGGAIHGACHEDAFTRALQMFRDHIPYGATCRDWGRP